MVVYIAKKHLRVKMCTVYKAIHFRLTRAAK